MDKLDGTRAHFVSYRGNPLQEICNVNKDILRDFAFVYPYKSSAFTTEYMKIRGTNIVQGGVINGDYLYYGETINNINGYVYKYDLKNKEFVTSVSAQYKHFGSITFNTEINKLIIIDGGTSNTELWFLNPEDLSLSEYKTIATTGKRIAAIAYNPVNGGYVLEFSKDGCWNDYSFAVVDSEFNILYEFEPFINGYVLQEIDCDGRYIYALYYNPNVIFVYDMNGVCVRKHNVDISTEPEFISIKEEELYVGENGEHTVFKLNRLYQWE